MEETNNHEGQSRERKLPACFRDDFQVEEEAASKQAAIEDGGEEQCSTELDEMEELLMKARQFMARKARDWVNEKILGPAEQVLAQRQWIAREKTPVGRATQGRENGASSLGPWSRVLSAITAAPAKRTVTRGQRKQGKDMVC
ncbi:hypothetical protein NDU88_000059 [Pleurodeles waltl]|uniref:Uncharacterized protein n=1 Tax=Pleurodeles waltl TaxID=8319 RepID=A0AAV7UPP4_PLEWA|nr:hypothetical protein NDU88_000059 [Pleurodeles waltl]